MRGPCLDCKYRRVGCHAYCRSYKEHKNKLDSLKTKDEYKYYMIGEGGAYNRMRMKRGVMRI